MVNYLTMFMLDMELTNAFFCLQTNIPSMAITFGPFLDFTKMTSLQVPCGTLWESLGESLGARTSGNHRQILPKSLAPAKWLGTS